MDAKGNTAEMYRYVCMHTQRITIRIDDVDSTVAVVRRASKYWYTMPYLKAPLEDKASLLVSASYGHFSVASKGPSSDDHHMHRLRAAHGLWHLGHVCYTLLNHVRTPAAWK